MVISRFARGRRMDSRHDGWIVRDDDPPETVKTVAVDHQNAESIIAPLVATRSRQGRRQDGRDDGRDDGARAVAGSQAGAKMIREGATRPDQVDRHWASRTPPAKPCPQFRRRLPQSLKRNREWSAPLRRQTRAPPRVGNRLGVPPLQAGCRCTASLDHVCWRDIRLPRWPNVGLNPMRGRARLV